MKRVRADEFFCDAHDEVRVSVTDQGWLLFKEIFDGRGSIIEATALSPKAFVRLQEDMIGLLNILLAASKVQRTYA